VTVDFEQIQADLREFARDRDWEQFHNPKNLAMALAGEVGELLAELQWRSADECEPGALSELERFAIEGEVADVFIYLARLCDRLDIDVASAVRAKMQSNASRYSPDKFRGSAAKAAPVE
jgi:NTP pyrophosphatase (non-canonical NTP hydrolase)